MNLRDKRNGREFTPEEEQQWDIIYNSLSPSQKLFFHSDEGSQFINNPYVLYSDERMPTGIKFIKFGVDTRPDVIINAYSNSRRAVTKVNILRRRMSPDERMRLGDLKFYIENSDKRKPLEDFLGKDAVDKMATNVNRMISRVNMPGRKHPPYLEVPLQVQYKPNKHTTLRFGTSVGFGGDKGEAELGGKDKDSSFQQRKRR